MLNTPEQSNQFKSPGEEIESLKRRIEELKTSSLEENREVMEIAVEAVKEHSKKAPEETLHEKYRYTPSAEELKGHHTAIFDLSPEEHDQQIAELLDLAEDKGVINVVNLVSKTGNAHLLDDFERALARKVSTSTN
ncbi:MAG: hypothetical protein COU71_02445 [Parcubacteria group bacterium CG10_big_fil_rev_8_21_14_0_10_38_31]|nr:MAG: hypothetical protein COU71_02445 [Parcubacteria group bacterium CG10_big_fil_rev_8_21_14_0_10_38_31]